jgi:hypothetical protein
VTFMTLGPVRDPVSKALLSVEIRHFRSGGEPDAKTAALLGLDLLGISSSMALAACAAKSPRELHHFHRPETNVFSPFSQCLFRVLTPTRLACLQGDCRPF